MEEEEDEAPVGPVSQASTALREMIVSGQLLPGQKINQVDVARRLGVSRSPLREALRKLEGEGLARYEINHGYIVTRLNMDELAEILELRDVIEGHLISHISAPDEESLTKLSVLLAEIEAAVAAHNFEALTSAVRRFRIVIYELSQRPIFLSELERLWKMTDLYIVQHMMPPDQRVIKDHRGIIEALAAGNLPRARKLLLGLRQLNGQVIVGLPVLR
jgi:DNA-binding GntR family transcriptional regulator